MVFDAAISSLSMQHSATQLLEFFLNGDAFCRFCRITRKQKKKIEEQNITSIGNRTKASAILDLNALV